MPTRRPPEPEIFRVNYLTAEEAEKRGIAAPPLPVSYDPATLTPRTLWQTWDRDRGGWTKALRFHKFLPLIKISMSADLNYDDESQGPHYWSGRCWIVEDHPRACQGWGEEGEIGLGMGSPLFCHELDPGWMYLRTNRIALEKGRSHVEGYLLNEKGRAFYADLICADLINGSDDTRLSDYEHREPLYELWCKKLSSTKTGYKGGFYEREAALVMTPYMTETYPEMDIYERLCGIGLSSHEAVEAMFFKGWSFDQP